MAEFYKASLLRFSILFELFSNSNNKEKFSTLSEEELATLRSKNQEQNTSNSTKLG